MRRWITGVALGGVSVGLSLGGWAWLRGRGEPAAGVVVDAPISQVTAVEGTNPEANLPSVAGLDLTQLGYTADGVVAPAAGGRSARLTIDPDLEHTADELMASYHLPEAAIVMIDNETGNVIAYATHVEHVEPGRARDMCAEAVAPAASVFKIVTASALVEDAHLGPDTSQCYSGGSERVNERDLVDDPHRDRWCTTLAGAMGRSINTVFARLAQKDLKPKELEDMARRYGFGEGVPFDVPVQPSAVHVPTEPLEFARTAAGFWNTSLSPLEAAWMSHAVARGGEALRPVLVRDVRDAEGNIVYTTPPSRVVRRFVAEETAGALTTMMEQTVLEGTSYRAFHDARGHAFLPDIPVAGKTGTLTDAQTQRYFSWFTGFAPSRPLPGSPYKSVSIAVLIINTPNWQVKSNVVARDMLRAYFAAQNAPRVTKPSPSAIARHRKAS
jgi:cell division protein FtsI/penicillin-binding protein 2